MSELRPFDKYFQERSKELSFIQPDVFLSQALKYGYLPKSGTLPGLIVSKINPTNYKLVKIEHIKRKNGQKYINFDPPVTRAIEFVHVDDSGYRVYSLIHPYSYYLLCKEIADNLPRIIKVLTRKRTIISYSLPDLTNMKFRKEQGIKHWLRMAEQDLVAESGDYNFLLKSDISSFYSSIYTHSISWAIHGKKKSQEKKNHNNWRLIGNRLDKLARNCNGAQTNGLPIGPITSDILSELVLAAVDEDIEKKLKRLRVDFRASRYKDDYRFLLKTSEDAQKARRVLAEVLHDYGLTLNEKKTKVYGDIIQNYKREWKYALSRIGLEKASAGSLDEVSSFIDKIYRLQVSDIDYQPALTLLQELYKTAYESKIEDAFESDKVRRISAQLAHMYRLLPASLPVSIQILDLLMGAQSKKEKLNIVDNFVGYFGDIADDGMLAWMYAFYLRVSEESAYNFLKTMPAKDDMCKLLNNRLFFEEPSVKYGFKKDTVTFITRESIEDFQSKPIDVSLSYNASTPHDDFNEDDVIDIDF